MNHQLFHQSLVLVSLTVCSKYILLIYDSINILKQTSLNVTRYQRLQYFTAIQYILHDTQQDTNINKDSFVIIRFCSLHYDKYYIGRTIV